MRIPLFLLALLPAAAPTQQSRLTDGQAQLLVEVARQAAFAETASTFCAERDPRNAARYQSAWMAWQQRNRWQALLSGPVRVEMAPGELDNLRADARRQLSTHTFRAAATCATLQQQLSSPEHDPSRVHEEELQEIADDGAAAPSAEAPAQAAANSAEPAGASATAAGPARGGTADRSASTAAMASSTTPAEQREAVSPTAAPTSLEGVSFTPPRGWAAGTGPAAYVRKGKYGGRNIIQVSSRPLQADLSASLKSYIAQEMPGAGLKFQNVTTGRTPDGLQAVVIADGGHMRSVQNSWVNVNAVGIAAPGGRLVIAQLLSTADVGDRIDAEHALEEVVRSLRIAGTPPAARWDPLHPPAGSGGQRGLFWSNRMMNQLNPLGGMDLRAIREYVVLLPNGQVYRDLPRGGRVLDMDFAAAVAQTPLKCGTYRISGSTIHLIFPNEYGLLVEREGKWTGTGMVYDGGTYVPLHPVDHLRLAGHYTSTFAMSGNTAAGSNSIVSEHYITFTPDGRFQKSGFSSASFSNSGASGTVGSKRGVEAGTYDVQGYTLRLTPNAGEPELYTIVFETVSESPKAVWIDDNTYLR